MRILISLLILAAPALAAGKFNVLFINADDRRDEGGVFTRERVQTPNLDRLPVWKEAADLTPVGRFAGIGRHFERFTDRERRECLRADLAGVSYMDAANSTT